MASILRTATTMIARKAVGNYQCIALTSTFSPPSEIDANKQIEVKEFQETIKSRNEEDLPIHSLENPYVKPKCKCILCDFQLPLDYKNTKLLSQFISRHTGQLYTKSLTGLCEAQYKRLNDVISQSRAAGYMPHLYKDFSFLKDPVICSKRTKKF